MPDHYGDLLDAIEYHEARGNAAWSAEGVTDALRSAALVRASQALDAIYGPRYPGQVASPTQDLLWPRIGVVWRGSELADDVVPPPIVRATYELALRELVRPNSILPDVTPGSVKKSVAVSGAVSVTYAVDSDPAKAMQPVIALVDGILADLLISGPGNTSVTALARF